MGWKHRDLQMRNRCRLFILKTPHAQLGLVAERPIVFCTSVIPGYSKLFNRGALGRDRGRRLRWDAYRFSWIQIWILRPMPMSRPTILDCSALISVVSNCSSPQQLRHRLDWPVPYLRASTDLQDYPSLFTPRVDFVLDNMRRRWKDQICIDRYTPPNVCVASKPLLPSVLETSQPQFHA